MKTINQIQLLKLNLFVILIVFSVNLFATQSPLSRSTIHEKNSKCEANKSHSLNKQANLPAAIKAQECSGKKVNQAKILESSGSKIKPESMKNFNKTFGGSDLNMDTLDTEIFPALTQAGSVVWGHGSTIVTVYNDTSGAPDSFSGISVSSNDGTTFDKLDPNPFDTLFTTDAGSPAVAYDDNAGLWLALVITEDCSDQGIGLMSTATPETSASWALESCVHSGLADDRPMFWVDNNSSSPNYGRRYVSFNDFDASGALKVMWFNIGDSSWNEVLVDAAFIRNVNISGDMDGSNGYVYIFAMDEAGGAGASPLNVVYRSEDGGLTWIKKQYGSGYPAVGVGLCSGSDYFFMVPPNWRHMGWGQGAVGPGGVLHYVFARGSQTPEDYGDVYYVRSADFGANWSTPIHLNQDQDNKNNVIQWQPSISVTAQGLVLAAWYDRRNTTDGLNYQYYGRLSLDNGVSWQDDQPISDMIIPQATQYDPMKEFCFAGESNIHNTLSNDALVTWTDGRNLKPNGEVVDEVPVEVPQMDVYFKRVPLCPAIGLTPGNVSNGEKNIPYVDNVTGTGGTGPYTYALSGALPVGLLLNETSGEISGTPLQSGNFLFSVVATDSFGCEGSENFGLVINPDPNVLTCQAITIEPMTLLDGAQGANEDQLVTASGGTGDYTYEVTDGALPIGVELDSVTGAITGIPQESSSFNFDITATDGNGCTGTQSYTTQIACPMITLSPPTQLPDAAAGFPYLSNITANGGTAPYKFFPQSSTPTGIYYAEGGTVFGVAEKGGSRNTTIAVVDTNGCMGSQSFRLDSTNCPDGAIFCDKVIDLTGDPGDPLADPPIPPRDPNFTSRDVCGTSDTQWFETQSCESSDDIGHTPAAHAHWGLAVSDGNGGFTEDCASYGDGNPSQNTLKSQTFDVSQCNSGEVLLNFNYLISFEEDATFDRARVFVQADGGAAEVIADNGPGTAVCGGLDSPGLNNLKLWSGWQHFQVRYPATSTFKVRFVGETENDKNAGEGFFIDDVVLQCQCPDDFIMTPEFLPNAVQDQAYDVTITTEGGQPDVTFGTPPSSDPIPPGLNLDSATGVISGIPTSSGIFPFRLEATDFNACQIFINYNLVVSPPNCPAIDFAITEMDDGIVNDFYAASLDASGGTGPYTYAVSIGELPPGLSLNVDTGVVSGTPTTAGTYPFTITTLDSLFCGSELQFNVNISPEGCPAIGMTPTVLTNPDKDVPYSESVTASGGVAPYTYTVSNGNLPAGLTLDSVTGELSGTPTNGGFFGFEITAEDANGCFGSENYNFNIIVPDLIFKNGFEEIVP